MARGKNGLVFRPTLGNFGNSDTLSQVGGYIRAVCGTVDSASHVRCSLHPSAAAPASPSASTTWQRVAQNVVLHTQMADLTAEDKRARRKEVRREGAISRRALAARLLQQSVGLAVDLVDLVVDGLALAECRVHFTPRTSDRLVASRDVL
jgi:hypothetical protein